MVQNIVHVLKISFDVLKIIYRLLQQGSGLKSRIFTLFVVQYLINHVLIYKAWTLKPHTMDLLYPQFKQWTNMLKKIELLFLDSEHRTNLT